MDGQIDAWKDGWVRVTRWVGGSVDEWCMGG